MAVQVEVLGDLRVKVVLIVHLGVDQEAAINRDRVTRALLADLLPLRVEFDRGVLAIVQTQVVTLYIRHVLRRYFRTLLLIEVIRLIAVA